MRFVIVSDMNYGHPLSEIENHRYGIVSTIVTNMDISFVVVMGCISIVPEKHQHSCTCHHSHSHSHSHCHHCHKSSIESSHQLHVQKVTHALSTFVEQFVFPIEYAHKQVFLIRGKKDVIDDYQGSIAQYITHRYQNTFYYRYQHGILFFFLDYHPTAISRFWLSILLQKKASKCAQTPIVFFFYFNLDQSYCDTWPLHEQEAFYQTIHGCNILAIFTSSTIENIETSMNPTSLVQYPIYVIPRNQPMICTILSKGGHEYTVTCSNIKP